MKWEYDVVHFYPSYEESLQDKMEKLGQDEWEIFQVSETNRLVRSYYNSIVNEVDYILWVKRQVNDENERG